MAAISTASDGASNGDDGAISDADESQYNGLGKRKRPSKTSCEVCKVRKVKCDRAEPSCGWCTRNNRVCEYRERGKTGPRPQQYSRELEAKVNRLDAMLQVLGRRVEDHIYEHQDLHGANSQLASPMYSRPSEYSHQPYEGPREVTADSAEDTSPRLSLRPLASGPFSASPFHTRARSLLLDLPSYDLVSSLVDLYFKHINPWSPILNRNTTFDLLSTYSNPSESDHILLLAIVTATLRFSKDVRAIGDWSDDFCEASRQAIQLHALRQSSVKALQALLIIAVDVLGGSRPSLGSDLLAILARSIVQLGLDQEKYSFLAPIDASSNPSSALFPSHSLAQPASWIEDEERRRLFWMLYVLDRYASVAATTNFSLDDCEVDRALPCRYDLFSKNQPVETKWFRSPDSTEAVINRPQNLGSFSYHCEVLRILSRIHRFLRQPIDVGSLADVHRWRETYRELDADLNHWLQSLPGEYGKISQLCHSDPGSRISNWIMLHAAFVTSVIRLHSAAAYPTSRSYIFTPSQNAMQRCLSAVQSLREIAQDVVGGSMLDLLGPPFALSLWVCARLLIVHAATTEADVDVPNLSFFITTLESMGRYWQIAQVYAETLRRVLQETPNLDPDLHRSHSRITMTKYTSMRQLAHDLASFSTQKPGTLLKPPVTRNLSQSDLDALAIFDFFNYPRLPSTLLQQQSSFPTAKENHSISPAVTSSPPRARSNSSTAHNAGPWRSGPARNRSMTTGGGASAPGPYFDITSAPISGAQTSAVREQQLRGNGNGNGSGSDNDWLDGHDFRGSLGMRAGDERARRDGVVGFNPPHE